jgi:hypothetical protein
MHAYMHKHTQPHACINTYTYIQLLTVPFVHFIHTYTHTCNHYIHIYVNTNIHKITFPHKITVHCIHTYIHTYIHIHTHFVQQHSHAYMLRYVLTHLHAHTQRTTFSLSPPRAALISSLVSASSVSSSSGITLDNIHGRAAVKHPP